MKPFRKLLALCAVSSLLALVPAQAQVLIFTVDEFGNSNFGPPGQLLPDPTGGVPNANVLIYQLPFPGVAGDVLMMDNPANPVMLDVLRFDGNFHLIFYSDNADGFASPADTPSPPI